MKSQKIIVYKAQKSLFIINEMQTSRHPCLGKRSPFEIQTYQEKQYKSVYQIVKIASQIGWTSLYTFLVCLQEKVNHLYLAAWGSLRLNVKLWSWKWSLFATNWIKKMKQYYIT